MSSAPWMHAVRMRLIVSSTAWLAISVLLGCTVPQGGGSPTTNDNDNISNDNGVVGNDNQPVGNEPTWEVTFDASEVGFLSAVWGSTADDVFVVGGQSDEGQVFHFDGTTWRSMVVPDVARLIWVYGFGPDDVYAVGEEGTALRYDGGSWTKLDTGTTDDIWGVWGEGPTDIWLVGGDTNDSGAPPLILNYNGCCFTRVELSEEENDRAATALFKVWGIDGRVFAVGAAGLIVELDPNTRTWHQMDTGASEDFVSLWGTSAQNIVAVGGRANGQVARFDGTSWTTLSPSGTPGLNAVFMSENNEAIIGGTSGYGARFDLETDNLSWEYTGTGDTLHGAWCDGTGDCFVVGGMAVTAPGQSSGLALVRSMGGSDKAGLALASEPASSEPRVSLIFADDNRFLSDGTTAAPPKLLDIGDAIAFYDGIQGGTHIEPMALVSGFPAELDDLANYSYELRLVASGEVIASATGLKVGMAACACNGCYQFKRQYVFKNGVTSDSVVDQTAEFSLTVWHNGESSTISASASALILLESGGPDLDDRFCE